MTVSDLVVAILRENIAVDATPAVVANLNGVDVTPADMIARIEAADPAALAWVQVVAAASIRFAIRRVERRVICPMCHASYDRLGAAPLR